MRLRAPIMLAIACLLGVVAVFLTHRVLQQTPEQVMVERAGPAMTKVVVAKLPVRFGDAFSHENLTEVDWPVDTVPQGAFTSIDEMLAGNERRAALRDMEVSEVVLRSRVSGFGGRASLSSLISDGMRAVTVRVNDVQGVAGFVLPGDRVDVLLNRPEDMDAAAGQQVPPVTDVLLQNVRVLAVDQVADNRKEEPQVVKAVTLEVSTEQAQKLALASQVGTLNLALRNSTNVTVEETETVTARALTGEEPVVQTVSAPAVGVAAPRRPAPPQPLTVRVVRGVEQTMEEVARDRGIVRSARQAPVSAPVSAPMPPAPAAPAAEPAAPGNDDAPLVLVPRPPQTAALVTAAP